MKRIMIVLCVFIFCCARNTSQMNYWIENTLKADEVRVIFSAQKEWENKTGVRILNYKGRVKSRFSKKNYLDNRIVVYKLLAENREASEIVKKIERIMAVKNIIAFANKRKDIVYLHYAYEKIYCKTAKTCIPVEHDQYLRCLEDSIMHEMGHVFGMDHSDRQGSVMKIPRSCPLSEEPHIDKIDVLEFCKIYDC